jgi:hypothetical protein
VTVKLSVSEYVPGGSVAQPRFVRNETVAVVPVVAPALPLPVFAITVPPLVLSAVPAVAKEFRDQRTVDAAFVGAGDTLPEYVKLVVAAASVTAIPVFARAVMEMLPAVLNPAA